MIKIRKKITAIALCLGMLVGVTGGSAPVKAETTTSFKETKLRRGARGLSHIIQDADANIVSYYKDADGINQKSAYNSKGDKWTTAMVKDSSMKIKGKKKYYTIYPAKRGYIEVAPDSSKIVVRDDEGEKLLKKKLSKIKGWKKKYVVKNVTEVARNRYLFICQKGEEEIFRAIYVNINTKRVIWERKNVSNSYAIINGEVYFYFKKLDSIGKVGRKTDIIRVYRLKDGGQCKCGDAIIDASSIRSRTRQLHGKKTSDTFPITDQGIVIAGYKNKLYAAYMSGIYEYQPRTKSWKCLIDGVKNSKFSLGKDMIIKDLMFVSKKEFYVLATKGSYEAETTVFIKYQLK